MAAPTVGWLLCDLPTGVVVGELPLTLDTIEATVGQQVQASASLLIHDPSCPAGWSALLGDPRRVMIVSTFDGEPVQGYILGDGIVIGAETVSLPLLSLEAAADQVNVGDYDFDTGTDTPQSVAAALCKDVLAAPGRGAWGFTLDVTDQAVPSGDIADGAYSYSYSEDRTVYSALTDLVAMHDGIEWGIRLAWSDPQRTRISKTIEIGTRFGSRLPDVVVDDVTVTARTRTRSRGASITVAVSDGSGSDRPMSSDHEDSDALDGGTPRWERRTSYTGVDDDGVLNQYAFANLLRTRLGVETWDVTLDATHPACPIPGRDFDAGDTIVAALSGFNHDPATWRGDARLVGWKATLAGARVTAVTPVLWDETDTIDLDGGTN